MNLTNKNTYTIIRNDCVSAMKTMPDRSIDLIFADPPYFLSSGKNTSCSGGKRVTVVKGEWDKPLEPEEMHVFNLRWITESHRLLRDTGSIFVSGTQHNIFDVAQCLREAGFVFRNVITWQKTNPPPNLSCRCLKHSSEFIIWAVKDQKKYLFNYNVLRQLNGGKQMGDVWTGSLTPKSKKTFGCHPTQKPLYLLNRIVLAAFKPGDTVLDPFCGSGTTGVAAVRNQRYFIGIDAETEYVELSRLRIENEIDILAKTS